jgi:hypothetical protein
LKTNKKNQQFMLVLLKKLPKTIPKFGIIKNV